MPPTVGTAPDNTSGVRITLQGMEMCPVCQSPLVPVLYGYPGLDAVEAEERGELVLGGCVVGEGMPELACPRGCDPTT